MWTWQSSSNYFKLNFNFDDIRADVLQVLTCYSFSRSLCYDMTPDTRTNTYK